MMETRVFVVPHENLSVIIPPPVAPVEVGGEDRTTVIPAESRATILTPA